MLGQSPIFFKRHPKHTKKKFVQSQGLCKSDVKTFYGNGLLALCPTHKLVDEQGTHPQLPCMSGDYPYLLEVWLYQTIRLMKSDRQSVSEVLNL
jgi:hypothetical protein